MDMDGMVMMMTPYLHFTTDYGDPLWFAAWAPVSSGAIAGACIGLVMLAMFERLLNGIQGVLEQEWVVRYVCSAGWAYLKADRLVFALTLMQIETSDPGRHSSELLRYRSSD